VLIGLALVAVLTALTLPVVVSQTRRLAWDEVLVQIERQAAVVRGSAQRRSEPVWLEARWLEGDKVWALGTRTMTPPEEGAEIDAGALSGALLEEMDSYSAGATAGATDDAPMVDDEPMVDDDPEAMSDFEVVMRLPTGFTVSGVLPEEVEALRDRGGPVDASDAGLEPLAVLDEHASPPEEDAEALSAAPTRALVAVFLPDGTLIGPDRLYVQSPQGRLATMTTSRWLGSVKCATLTLGDLARTGDADALMPEEEPADGGGEPVDLPADEPGVGS
jgi:hypothetical protein